MSMPRVFDAPVSNPDNDLLNMSPYARTLLKLLPTIHPPLTIGVYGEWGEGKTTFVKLLEYLLTHPQLYKQQPQPDKPVKFITFSAWPHTTSDKLWRALILKIARELYEVRDDNSNSQTSAGGAQLPASIARYLNGDALVLFKPPPADGPDAKYQKLVEKLDETYGSISKNTEQQFQIDQEMAMMAIVKAAVGALGVLSPLVGALKGLLGLDTKVNLAELVHKEKNAATREAIRTVEQFQKLFHEVFEERGKKYSQIIVFVDDLDRCMPDVALDVLEAIKIFLGDTSCVFIVAADEHLIGQGLKLRYRDLFEKDDSEESKLFFARKGQEYFEKIIQLGIRVPPRTPEQTHRLVSAEFPHLTPATDIIQTVVGNNPRRLKQYCNWLSYRHLVLQLQKEQAQENQGQGK